MNRRLHTPEGVRDIIGSEYKRKISIEKQLSEIIETYGYDPIQTPSFEYFDLFGSKMGTVSSKNLYKFFDREGETIVLRPDFTPSIARCVSRYYNDRTAPLRLYYKGSVFSNQKTLRGNLNERTQIGGECIGEESIETDAEMISMIVRGLIACGLSDFGITIGHSAIFDGLMDAASFDEDTRDDIRLMIANKNYFGLEEYLEGMDIPAHLADAFSLLSNMYRSPDEFRNLLELVSDISPVSDAICYLADLYDLLTLFEVSEYVTFDLGLVSDFRYYTGIVFSGYAYDSGQPIVKGGRYDHLLGRFGRELPALGFAVDVDHLLITLERQDIDVSFEDKKQVIIYTREKRDEAIRQADTLRRYKSKVLMVLAEDAQQAEVLSGELSGYEIKKLL